MLTFAVKAPAMKKHRRHYPDFRLFLLTMLLCILSRTAVAEPVTDSLKSLAAIPGADMTVYQLYKDYLPRDYAQSMQYAEIFLNGIDTDRPHPCIARLADELSSFYDSEKEVFSLAIEWAGTAESQYRMLGDRYAEARTRYNLARLYSRRQQYHKALEYINLSEPVFREYGDRESLMDCLNLMGAVHFACRDFEAAGRFFQQYREESASQQDSLRQIVALTNLAAFAQVEGDMVKSFKFIEEAISLSRLLKDSAKLGYSYLNYAALLINARQYPEAEEYLSLSRPLLNSSRRLGKYYLNYAILHRNRDENEAAVAYLDSAILHYSHGEHEQSLVKCYTRLIDIYEEAGDTNRRNAVAEDYYRIHRESDETEAFRELFQHQNEIILQKDAERELERKNSRLVTWLTATFSTLLLLMGWLLYRRRKAGIIREKENELERQRLLNERKEQEIKNQNEILEIKKIEQFKLQRITDETIDKLTRLNLEIKERSIRNRITRICNELQDSLHDDQLKELNQYIPEFNSAFFQNLVKAYPELTTNERRLCVLLNLNLSTKEISDITRQSPHSINIARGRLRNKLGLTGSDTSLQEFLSKFN